MPTKGNVSRKLPRPFAPGGIIPPRLGAPSVQNPAISHPATVVAPHRQQAPPTHPTAEPLKHVTCPSNIYRWTMAWSKPHANTVMIPANSNLPKIVITVPVPPPIKKRPKRGIFYEIFSIRRTRRSMLSNGLSRKVCAQINAISISMSSAASAKTLISS